jgi:hypothetical protein
MRKAMTMRTIRPMFQSLCLLLVVWAVGTGCAYDAAVRRLSLPEQAEFFLYRNAMTGTQERAYLAKTTAAERTAYLYAIGLAQRFQAFDAFDQAAIRSGWPWPGMSADALFFLWGEPYYTSGDARRSAHWYYLGFSMELAAHGNQYRKSGNRVDVYLVDGRVRGWVDYIPSDVEPGVGFRW